MTFSIQRRSLILAAMAAPLAGCALAALGCSFPMPVK
jgi:hypothetical protein